MTSRLLKGSRASAAFTLVEVLVSITVLGLMMVGVAQLMNGAIKATLGGFRHMDADTQARMVLDRMAFDISKITKRADVDYYLQKNTGNDQMAFYSESGGYYPSGVTGTVPESDVSLVGYRINANYQMERLSKGLIWNGVTTSTPGATSMSSTADGLSPMVFLPQTIAATWPNVEGAGTDGNYQVIGDQIFRLEICYLVQNTSTTTLSSQPYLSPNTGPNGLQDLVAVVVSLGVLDSESRAGVSHSSLTTAISDLPDVTAATITSSGLPVTLWKAALLNNGLGLPAGSAGQVRFYQRYCYINHVQ